MKIAIFTETYLPQINGVVTSTVTFTRELERLGHEVIIIGPKMKGARESTDKVWRFNSMPYPFQTEHRIISPLSRKLNQFKEAKFDIVHVQTPFLIGHLGQYLGKKYDIPVIHTYHTYWMEYLYYFPLLPKRLRPNADNLFTKNFCNRCAHIVVPSKQMHAMLIERGVSVPMTVIPTGIDTGAKPGNAQAFRKRYHIKPTDKVVIFVGRLGKEKNIYFLLESFKHVKGARLLIVGDGPERDEIHRRNPQAIMTGYVPHGDVLTAYAASDIIAFPSKTETQGLSLLEGLSMGKPAVCLDAMGVKDILHGEQGGFLVQEDPHGFAEKIMLLLNDPSIYKMKSEQALKRAHEFSAPEMAKKLVSVYEREIKK